MKKILFYISSGLILTLGSCTKNFQAINTDPTQASAAQFDPNLLLPSAEAGYFSATQGYNGAILLQSMWIQTFASAAYPSYYSNGDKYVSSGNLSDYDARLWNSAYGAASAAYEAQNLAKSDPSKSNLSGICLIIQLLNLEAVTDTYGDCPFSEALQAKTGVAYPVYDKQQDIYNSMLSKLDSVIPTLDASKAKPTNDAFIYAGNIAAWKKFGYSLMLRMAMRLTKADAATAQKYAEKAYAGGAFASSADDCYMVLDDPHGFTNGNASALGVSEDYVEVRWGKVLIDYLKTTNDPRLPVIAEVPLPGLTNANNKALAGVSTAALQQGMPNGYDQNGGATDISTAPGYPGSTGTGSDANKTGGYSRPTTALYLSRSSPAYVLNYAQTELLFAEAAARGWSVGASASVHYANAIAAALQIYGVFNGTTPISSAAATAYATANPLDVSTLDNSLKQINTQYWILTGTGFDFEEAWSNWRRSGYPVLTPVNYIGNFSGGVIPRRQTYPTTESATNPTNYSSAAGAITGGDVFSAHVWWDK